MMRSAPDLPVPHDTKRDGLAPLNAEQRRAVLYGMPPDAAGPLLVIAGAGTGKTSTLAHRVAQMVIHGADPGRILLLTFTRRAAADMRRRVHDIVRDTLGDTLGNKAQAVLRRSLLE